MPARPTPVSVGAPGETSAAMPDEAEQPVSALNASGDSQEVSDAAHGSKDSLEDLRNPVLDHYVALMTYMQATRAEIVRGICTFSSPSRCSPALVEGKTTPTSSAQRDGDTA